MFFFFFYDDVYTNHNTFVGRTRRARNDTLLKPHTRTRFARILRFAFALNEVQIRARNGSAELIIGTARNGRQSKVDSPPRRERISSVEAVGRTAALLGALVVSGRTGRGRDPVRGRRPTTRAAVRTGSRVRSGNRSRHSRRRRGPFRRFFRPKFQVSKVRKRAIAISTPRDRGAGTARSPFDSPGRAPSTFRRKKTSGKDYCGHDALFAEKRVGPVPSTKAYPPAAKAGNRAFSTSGRARTRRRRLWSLAARPDRAGSFGGGRVDVAARSLGARSVRVCHSKLRIISRSNTPISFWP